jgi:hypothetical protein
MRRSTTALLRTFAAVSLVALGLGAALLRARTGLAPVRSTVFELDEPTESPPAAPSHS